MILIVKVEMSGIRCWKSKVKRGMISAIELDIFDYFLGKKPLIGETLP